jgi:hypothetical protein
VADGGRQRGGRPEGHADKRQAGRRGSSHAPTWRSARARGEAERLLYVTAIRSRGLKRRLSGLERPLRHMAATDSCLGCAACRAGPVCAACTAWPVPTAPLPNSTPPAVRWPLMTLWAMAPGGPTPQAVAALLLQSTSSTGSRRRLLAALLAGAAHLRRHLLRLLVEPHIVEAGRGVDIVHRVGLIAAQQVLVESCGLQRRGGQERRSDESWAGICIHQAALPASLPKRRQPPARPFKPRVSGPTRPGPFLRDVLTHLVVFPKVKVAVCEPF